MKENFYFVFVLVHSDDLIVISNRDKIMQKEKLILLNAFEGVDQGNLSSFRGVEITMDEKGIKLSMMYYWKKLMKRFGTSENSKRR